MKKIHIKNIINLILFLIFILQGHLLLSQTDIPIDTIQIDSAEAEKLGLFNKENRQTFKLLFSGKPAKAMMFSLFLPGAGQAFNGRYWKMPIVWGLVGYFGYNAFKANKDYVEIDQAYRCMLENEGCSYKGITDPGQLRPYRDNARSYKERMWVTFSIVYLVQAIEAYIDSHLIDFDLSKDLSVKSGYGKNGFSFGFKYNLNGNKKRDFGNHIINEF